MNQSNHSEEPHSSAWKPRESLLTTQRLRPISFVSDHWGTAAIVAAPTLLPSSGWSDRRAPPGLAARVRLRSFLSWVAVPSISGTALQEEH